MTKFKKTGTAKKRAPKKALRAKIAKVVVSRVEKLDEDKHLLAIEAEIHGPLVLPLNAGEGPILPAVNFPLVVTPDDPEPAKRGFWARFFDKFGNAEE